MIPQKHQSCGTICILIKESWVMPRYPDVEILNKFRFEFYLLVIILFQTSFHFIINLMIIRNALMIAYQVYTYSKYKYSFSSKFLHSVWILLQDCNTWRLGEDFTNQCFNTSKFLMSILSIFLITHEDYKNHETCFV